MKRFCFLLLLCSLSVFSQKTGSLSGTITDLKTGEVLIGATVVIDSLTLGASTDLDGFYTIDNIPLGSHNVTASYVGFKPQTRFNVNIKTVANADINFSLEDIATGLDEIIVRPDPFVKNKENPLSVQSLTTEEIVAYPGGNNDIAKVVQSFPGVAGSIGGFRNDIIIRGGAPNEVVYYLDGIEIPNINHFATQGSGGGPVSLLNVSFFEGVNLSTSAFSAQYDNVLSGVLQFDQRNGNDREMRRNLRVSASETALTLEGPLFKGDNKTANTSYIVSARRSYLQLLFKLIGLPFLPDYWDFQAKVNHKIDDYNSLTFIGLGSIDDFSLNVPDDITEEQRAQLDDLAIIKQWSNTLGVSWNHRFKDINGFWRNSLSFNTLNNDFTQFRDNINETDPFFTNDSRETEIKLRSELTNYLNDWKFNSGVSIQSSRYRNITSNLIDNVSFESELDFLRYGLYGQASRAFFSNSVNVSGGFRFDANTFTEDGNNLLETFSPRLSLSVRLDKNDLLRLNASAGSYYRLPALTVLGFQDNQGNFANQDAEYIRSNHYVLGLEYVPRSSLRINVEAFVKRYSNYPVSLLRDVSLANLGGDFEVTGNEDIASIGLGRTRGLEISAQQKLTRNFFAIVAYTLYESEFTGSDTNRFLPSAWDYSYLFSFTGGYKFKRNWELGVKVRGNGKAPFAEVDQAATLENFPAFIFDYSDFGSQRLDAFTAVDVRIDKKWNFEKWSFNLYLDLQNVTSADQVQPPVFGLNRDENGDVIEPRDLIEITNLSQGTLLPSIGFIVDF